MVKELWLLMTKEQYDNLAKRAGLGENIWSEAEVSDCCGDEVIMGDICKSCLEHCDVFTDDIDNDGGYDQYKEERAGLDV
jgi:hypothetical protein